MMKNFTKILLGLIALATSISVNAEMEWRVVKTTDFGGNDASDDPISNIRPDGTEYFSNLNWIGQRTTSQPGDYLIIKSTELAVMGERNGTTVNLTNWGHFMTGQPIWATGGDHTNPDDKNKGYFMVFDCTPGSDIVLYKKDMPVSCAGVKFDLEAYFTALDCQHEAPNIVSVSIESNNVVLKADTLNIQPDKNGSTQINEIRWRKCNVEFEVTDPSITSVDFVVKAIGPIQSTGWDIGMDDITISVSQPAIDLKTTTYFYQQPAVIQATYVQSDFDKFFGGSSDIYYEWFYKQDESSSFSSLGSKKKYNSGDDISYTIPSFEKENDNGIYKIVIATSGNFESNLCSIQKEITVKQEKNAKEVTICADSTKVVDGNTLQGLRGVETKKWPFASIEYVVKSIQCEELTTPVYKDTCVNAANPTEGNFAQDPIIERDANGCPTSIQQCTLRVSAIIPDDPAHICQDSTYKSVRYDNVDLNGTIIQFVETGCSHEQKVYVHPNETTTSYDTICVGDSYMGVTYNTPGSKDITSSKLKTIYGCDSIVLTKLTIGAPQTVTLAPQHVCPSDNFVFGGVVYNYPFRGRVHTTCPGINKCDSTTYLDLVVEEGGTIEKDTLICREQILWGDSFMVAGIEKRTRSGLTESGCPIDTIWTIEVVQVSLRLRLLGNQDEICEGNPANLEAKLKAYDARNGKTLTPTYHWEPELETNTLTPELYMTETTTYTIYADLDLPSDIDRNAKGCHASAVQTITVNPVPKLSVDSVNPDNRSVEYTVEDGTMPYKMYLGSKNLGEVDPSGTQDHLPYGKHILQVQDAKGCTAEEIINVEATQPEPDMFFSPNNDGENDYWKIKDIDVYPTSSIRIYDRYGKLLHSATGAEFETGWDGTYNGNKMPATDYWYEIDIEEIDKVYFGHFTLMR